MSAKAYVAVDLGAGSGRVIAGTFDGRGLELEVVHRFGNSGVTLPTGKHWNLPQLFAEILLGLRAASAKYGAAIRSIAIDTWGVDYGLVDAAGRLLGLPWMYRDARTDGWMDRVATTISREEIYHRTGIQFLPFNSIYQLAAEAHAHPHVFAAADRVLFVPDLLNHWLTGRMTNERTIASTSQLLRAGRAEWDVELAAAAGIPTHIFHPLIEPCERVGELLPALCEETGCPAVPVIACGAHDTASAVAGVPASGALFLSSGTWSLIGRELPAPIVSREAFAAGFSNEHGICGTTRFLKNVTGMWLLQECMRTWCAEDPATNLEDILRGAAEIETGATIDPDDECFQRPCDMPAAIAAWLGRDGHPAPASREETAAIVLRSLALRYRDRVETLREWMSDLPDTLHVVGGGSQNALLNQMTADATGLRVEAGPVEATAAGNILAQMIADREISSLDEGRGIVRRSFEPRVFEPGKSK